MQIHELTAAECPGLVHADVDTLAREAFAHRFEQVIDEFINTGIIDEHGVLIVNGNLLPRHKALQMSQRLNAGDELDAVLSGEGIQLTQLFTGISAAHVAEIGLVLYLIGVLGVEHNAVIAHFFQINKICFQGFDAHHGIAGHIQHHAQRLIRIRFHGKVLLGF